MAEMMSPIDEDKKSPMQSFKDLRLELIKTAGNNPQTPLDVKIGKNPSIWLVFLWEGGGMFLVKDRREKNYYTISLYRNVETTKEQGFKRN